MCAGVKPKLHHGDPPPETDETVVQNIVNDQRRLEMVHAGKSFYEVAGIEGVSKRRSQDVTNLELPALDALDRFSFGEQPNGLTTDTLTKTRFPAVRSDQRKQFASL